MEIHFCSHPDTLLLHRKQKIMRMNFKEKLSPSAQKKLSDILFILYAGGAALLSYSLVYALRKPFTAATFDGMELFGMDYKVATSIIQIFGYMMAKFIGIKLISELKREGRLKFILVSVLIAELSLVLFGCLPRPFNVLALFFNGLSLGCMWGVIFSFLEGRRVTDLLASLFGLSIAVSSGTAKSIGLFVVNSLGVSEFWMPALIGAAALPLLAGLGCVLNSLPKPTAEDRALRVERVTLNNKQRWQVFRSFAPVLTILFFANLFLTVLQDVKEDFLVKIIDVDAAGLSSWAFAKVDGIVTLIILAVFALLSFTKSHIKVLSFLLILVIIGGVTLSFVAFNYHSLQLSPLVWLFIQSLCLYFSYLSFQTIFFDRFIACFRIKGNVGFFIAMIDSIGYTGTVLVLIFKEFFNPDVNWLEFYNAMAGTVGVICCVAFSISFVYLWQRYKRGNEVRLGEKQATMMGTELYSA